MLQKGAIAGKMMGSQWFAYSKYRGDWQNLSVCKNLDNPIQFVRTRPFCVRISEYIRNLLESSHPARHHSYLAVQCSRPRAQNLVERKTKWAIRNMGKHRNFGSRRLCCHVDRHYYVIMGWWHVVTTGTGQWSVTRSVVTRPIVRWPAPMGWPVPELPVPHNGPSLYAGLNWPQSSATCHREHHAKQKPLKPRTKNN